MRLFTTYSHTSTLRGYEASGKRLQQKVSNEERKTEKMIHDTPANGGIDRHGGYHFHRLARETGAEKREQRELCRKIETITKCESAEVERGRVEHLASKKTQSGRNNVPERATDEAQLARVEWTWCPTLRGRRQTGRRITRKMPPGKMNKKPKTKTISPRRSKCKNREKNRIKHSRVVVA